jgi:hypothetical protein
LLKVEVVAVSRSGYIDKITAPMTSRVLLTHAMVVVGGEDMNSRPRYYEYKTGAR